MMAGHGEPKDKTREQKREVGADLTISRAHQHVAGARPRKSKAYARSGSSARPTGPPDATEDASEASSSTRKNGFPGPEELSGLSRYFEDAPPVEILDWAVRTYGERLALLVSFGGPGGMSLLDMLSRLTDEVTVLTIDTGFLFEETVGFRKKAMKRYRLPVEVLKPELTLEEQVERYGERMRTCSPDLCCQVRKIRPLKKAMGRYDAWITGIRREQTPQRANTPVVSWDERFGAAKISPFASVKEGWIQGYVAKHSVPINPLLERGYKSIGCEPQTRPVAPDEDHRAGRWSGTEKTECGLHWVEGRAARADS